MFRRNHYHAIDPFHLSLTGRLRAMVSWLRCPASMSRWLVALLLACSIFAALSSFLLVLQQPGSAAGGDDQASGFGSMRAESPPHNVDSARVGPRSASIASVPGYDCGPMLSVPWPPPITFGPTVVVIGSGGVLYGPRCLVSGGVSGGGR